MTFAFSLMLVVFGLLAILGVPLSFTTGIASLVYFHGIRTVHADGHSPVFHLD